MILRALAILLVLTVAVFAQSGPNGGDSGPMGPILGRSGVFTSGNIACGGPGSTQLQDCSSNTGNNSTLGGPGLLAKKSPSSAPSSVCSTNAYSAAFNCDLTNLNYGVGTQITGTATLGEPATGYSITPNLAATYTYFANGSGWNQDTADNNGRTGAEALYVKIDNTGQGDTEAFFCNGFVNSTKSGATSFLASPEVGCINGQMIAGAAGAYLEGIGDINLQDGGFDVAAIANVYNLKRTVATGAINANWGGINLQSSGTEPVDWMYRASGRTRFGIDFTALTFPDFTLQAIALSSGGSGYTVGDVLTASGGTADQALTLRVLTVNSGVILTFAVDRGGLYTVTPGASVSVTGGTGSGATFSVNWTSATSSPAIVTAANQCWYGNGAGSSAVYGTSFSSTVQTNTSYMCWSSSLTAWNIVANNSSVIQAGSSQVIVNTKLLAETSMVVGGGTISNINTGEIGLTKITASGSAPGAAGGKFELVCGTNSGTAKLIAYAGTSTTPVTIVDNIGSGVTGC